MALSIVFSRFHFEGEQLDENCLLTLQLIGGQTTITDRCELTSK